MTNPLEPPHHPPENPYLEMSTITATQTQQPIIEVAALTAHEVMLLRQLLHRHSMATFASSSSSPMGVLGTNPSTKDNDDADSEYSEFPETTHAWAVFADKPQRKATKMDRVVGTAIIAFQLFTYTLFVLEAIEDYKRGSVPIRTTHDNCLASDEAPNDNFICEAEFTSHLDALVAFFMLSIFLTPEILQAVRAVRSAALNMDGQTTTIATLLFAGLAALEVIFAYMAATIAISYQLYIGEVTDAIEVGVGLLFIRELSARAYHGIRHKGVKQYRAFFVMLTVLLFVGFLVEAMCEAFIAKQRYYVED